MPGIFACGALGQGCGSEHTAYCSGFGLCGFYISKITLRFSQEMTADRGVVRVSVSAVSL